MEIRQVRYFLAVARSRNFSRAAERVHITQPALSQQIRKLEEELCTPLFERHRQGVSLTPAGMAFYAYALAITDQTERIKAHLKRLYDTGNHGHPARPPCKGSYKHF